MLEKPKPHYLNDDEWNADAIVADCKKTINLRETAGTDPNQGEIERLAALDPISYDGEREAAAERLTCRVSTLDKLVSAKRAETATFRGG